ncbi:hypothetical protein [Paramagnetospirillum magneticum]|uniref:Uncharacterized protein n=1 Tax=Paramagnetospirillum magneticum (strain ATCC 700264 / AMB-1) TaxID=342108 RepID=Q2W5B1_PARM1|nr:hypothetical protein [Paramagnetospirillum magneticum]BAE50964.1 hypothetical protein amb2160 [Paramagnetospirillum magneticum AMB-1]
MSISATSSVGTTQTSYPVLVNGILCFSAADVAAARNFVDPNADREAASTTISSVSAQSPQYPRTVNGRLCFSDADAAAARNYTSVNRPQQSGTLGRVVDIYA